MTEKLSVEEALKQEKLGWYKTKNGKTSCLLHCLNGDLAVRYKFVGYTIEKEGELEQLWTDKGEAAFGGCYNDPDHIDKGKDLVEYLGPELPEKEKWVFECYLSADCSNLPMFKLTTPIDKAIGRKAIFVEDKNEYEKSLGDYKADLVIKKVRVTIKVIK